MTSSFTCDDREEFVVRSPSLNNEHDLFIFFYLWVQTHAEQTHIQLFVIVQKGEIDDLLLIKTDGTWKSFFPLSIESIKYESLYFLLPLK